MISNFRQGLLYAGLFSILGGVPARANMVIIPNYDSSVPASAVAAFNSVISLFDSYYTNNITVNINVTFNGSCSGSCLGDSETSLVQVTYSQWYAAMGTDAGANPANTYLAAGYASLPATNPFADPTNNPNDYVVLTNANAQALGLVSGSASPDSTISFNTGQNYEYTGIATAGYYDFMNTAEHELDEALGIGTELNVGYPYPSQFMPEDYFRYQSAGVRGSSTDSGQTVYFSYDGGMTQVATFNTNPSGDINDWAEECGTPHVQDAFTCSGEVATYDGTSPEFAVMSTLGYDSAVPEPATWALMGGGLAGLAILRRRWAR